MPESSLSPIVEEDGDEAGTDERSAGSAVAGPPPTVPGAVVLPSPARAVPVSSSSSGSSSPSSSSSSSGVAPVPGSARVAGRATRAPPSDPTGRAVRPRLDSGSSQTEPAVEPRSTPIPAESGPDDEQPLMSLVPEALQQRLRDMGARDRDRSPRGDSRGQTPSGTPRGTAVPQGGWLRAADRAGERPGHTPRGAGFAQVMYVGLKDVFGEDNHQPMSDNFWTSGSTKGKLDTTDVVEEKGVPAEACCIAWDVDEKAWWVML